MGVAAEAGSLVVSNLSPTPCILNSPQGAPLGTMIVADDLMASISFFLLKWQVTFLVSAFIHKYSSPPTRSDLCC